MSEKEEIIDDGWLDNDNYRRFREEFTTTTSYIQMKSLRIEYVITKYGKLVDEDTKQIIKNPHDAILDYKTSSYHDPKLLAMWDNIKIVDKNNHKIFSSIKIVLDDENLELYKIDEGLNK